MVGEYASFMMILFLIVSILPAIGCLLSIIPTWKYCLDDSEHRRILWILKQRREKGLAEKPENFDATEIHDEITGEVITQEEFDERVALDRERNKAEMEKEEAKLKQKRLDDKEKRKQAKLAKKQGIEVVEETEKAEGAEKIEVAENSVSDNVAAPSDNEEESKND